MRHLRSTSGTIHFPPGYDGLLDRAVHLQHGQMHQVPDEVAEVLLQHEGVEDVTPDDAPQAPDESGENQEDDSQETTTE